MAASTIDIGEFNERATLRRQLHEKAGAIVHTESRMWRCVLAERDGGPIGTGTPIPERVGKREVRTRIYVASSHDRGRLGATMLASRMRMAGIDARVGQYGGLPQEAGDLPQAARNGSYIAIDEEVS